MGKEERAERLKEAIIRRKLERDGEDIEEFSPEEESMEDENEVDFEDLLAPVEVIEPEEVEEEYDVVEDEEVEDYFEVQVALMQEAGFEAYLEGQSFEENPLLSEEITESFIPEEAALLAESWEAGWFEAHRESWTAELILASKHLVECEDADAAADLVDRMEQAIGVLDGLMDFKAYEEFWGFKDSE
jgi:hypothetical protein